VTAQIVFDHVVKRFAKGSYQDSMRDLVAALFRRGSSDARRQWFNALDDVSFEVARGESVGVIGPNGSGKSTALKLLTGIYLPTSGAVSVDGRVAPLIEVGAGFHPDLSGRENIYLNAAITGMSRAEIQKHFDEIVEFSGLAEFLDTPVKRYSSGMYMRLGFSIAAHVPSDVLVVDEVLAVGDIAFRAKCVERMKTLKAEGRTILFVSHHGPQVRSVCDRVVYLLNGKKLFDGDAAEGTRRYEADVLAGRAGSPGASGRATTDAAVAIVEARVLHDASDEGVVVATTEALDVRVTYRVKSALPAPPQISVGLLRGDGVMACVLATHEKGFRLSGDVGDHAVTARFDALPLYPSRYGVEVVLWDASGLVATDQASAGAVEVRLEGRTPINRPGVFEPAGGFRAEGP
jgi:ABC-type polysaccharide/polyol phosphate transport system ATPase subunit